MKRPLVTFYMQAYNAEKYIERSIDSILDQSLGDIEFILVNNASTDGTGEICRRYAQRDSRIIYHENEQNTILHPEYKGKWIHPHGEYFSCLDADDYLDIDFVEVMYKAARDHDADLAVCGTEMFRDSNPNFKGVRIPPAMATKNISLLAEKFSELYGSLRPLWGKLYRTEFYLEYGIYAFDRPAWLLSGADTFAVLRYLRKCRSFLSIDRVLHHYRVHDSSYYHSNVTNNRVLECGCLYKEGLDLLKEWNAVTPERVKFLQDVHLGSIRDCMNNAVRNTDASLKDRLDLMQSITTDEIFCSYILTDQNRAAASAAIGSYLKKIISGRPSVEIAKAGSFFIANLYRTVDKMNSHQSRDQIALLLSALCHSANGHLWGVEFLRKFGPLMPDCFKEIINNSPGAIPWLLKRPKILREIINGDLENVIACTLDEEAPPAVRKITEALPVPGSSFDKDAICEAKMRLSKCLKEGNLEETIPLLIFICDRRILDQDGIYFKIYISWQLGEKELALDTVEIATVFWDDDPDIMALCGDVFAAVEATDRAVGLYELAGKLSSNKEFKEDMRERINWLA